MQMRGVPSPMKAAAFHGHDTFLDAGGNKAARYDGRQSSGGAADEASAGTPRPDGPKPTDQQRDQIDQAFAGRHRDGGWKMKNTLLAPDERHAAMSRVHGTFFAGSKSDVQIGGILGPG